MTEKLPKHVLDGNILTTTDGKKIELASKQWQDFIQKVKPNSFWVVVGGEIEGYSCRRESIHNGDRWYAYKRIQGKLKKRYICSDEDMALNPTRAMFQEMAKALTQPVKPRKSSKAIALDAIQHQLTQCETKISRLNEEREKLEVENQRLQAELERRDRTIGQKSEIDIGLKIQQFRDREEQLKAFRKIVLRMPFYTYESFDVHKPSVIYDKFGRKYKVRGFGDYLDKLEGISTNHPKSGNGIVIPKDAIWKVYETDFDGILPQIEEVKRGGEIARDRGLTKTQLKQARKVGDRLLAKDGSVWELTGESYLPEEREFRCLLAGDR